MPTPRKATHIFHAPLTRRALLAAGAAAVVAGSRPAAGQSPPSGQVEINGRTYDAYVPAAIKQGQDFHFTCEFDASWIVFKTYGIDLDLEDQIDLIGLDTSIEPYHQETARGVLIHGGDISQYYSGDYKENFLARTTGLAMRKVFEHHKLVVTPVKDQIGIEDALRRGELVWMKATVDFLDWVPATWITPSGREFPTVLGNDHALVVMGFNAEGVVIRDPLGPTTTNWERPYQYEVPWPTFLRVFAAQDFDGLAVARPQAVARRA
ncbi:MAG: hypothetical protein H0T49_04215 [Chloroflexia bacterium]|nr:hypothetical protein [Chloroflexia bacterium]